MESPRIKRALISVSDKMGLASFAKGLVACGVEIYSTGGTRAYLVQEGIVVRDVSDYTGFPEMMDGRLKTLHPKVHGGILCRRDNISDMNAITEYGIHPFELVVVNLYPFEATIAKEGVTDAEAIENIDIGGPTMVRAAAKNHAFVTIVTSSAQYAAVLDQIQEAGATTLSLRRSLATEAFTHTADYDTAISRYFIERSGEGDFPTRLTLAYKRSSVLRYGENPHQLAALYIDAKSAFGGVVGARQLHGKELSYNNILDLDAALTIVRAFGRPAVAVIKHNNPCGAAVADSLAIATQKAMEGDPLSAFGSVLAMNFPIDAATAQYLSTPGLFVEAIVAPDFTTEGLQILTTQPKWKSNVRLLKTGPLTTPPERWTVRPLEGGVLVQEADSFADDESAWRVVTEAKPVGNMLEDLSFAWTMVRYVKSNAITICKDGMLLGVGAGQMSRVDSTEIAIKKAALRVAGAVLASDAFFPFPDSIELAAAQSIAAIIQPGGSKNDDAVIEACNARGLPMIFTGKRHFRH